MRRLRNLSVSGDQSDLGRPLCYVSENARIVVTSSFFLSPSLGEHWDFPSPLQQAVFCDKQEAPGAAERRESLIFLHKVRIDEVLSGVTRLSAQSN